MGLKSILNEEAGVLIGNRKGSIWSGRLYNRYRGGPSSVEFDWAWVMEREEKRGDVIGFWHTHPFGSARLSLRDIRTMQGWVTCLGKPLLCLVQDRNALNAYFFQRDADKGSLLAEAQQFGRGTMIIVDR